MIFDVNTGSKVSYMINRYYIYFFSVSNIAWLVMERHTLDMTIIFVGLMSLRIIIFEPFILIVLIVIYDCGFH